MTTNPPSHPVEAKLLDRCYELGLDNQETELLRDILGWNNRNGGVPQSYRGIEPQVSIASDTTKEDKAKAQAIAQLVRRIIGDELSAAVNADPIQTLQEWLKLPLSSVAWLIFQLELHPEMFPELHHEMDDISWKAPEQMRWRVMRTFSALLAYRQK